MDSASVGGHWPLRTRTYSTFIASIHWEVRAGMLWPKWLRPVRHTSARFLILTCKEHMHRGKDFRLILPRVTRSSFQIGYIQSLRVILIHFISLTSRYHAPRFHTIQACDPMN